MKRHKIYGPINEITRLLVCMMKEDPNGEWVKWEDFSFKLSVCKAESTRMEEIYERRIKQLKEEICTLRMAVCSDLDMPKCNCKEKYKEAWQWICSVHGYKRR